MRILSFLLSILILSSCGTPEWKKAILRQEAYRIKVIERNYVFENNSYVLEDSTTRFEIYNNKNLKIGTANPKLRMEYFFVYDSTGKLIEKLFCDDYCSTPWTDKYIYNSENKLEKIIVETALKIHI